MLSRYKPLIAALLLGFSLTGLTDVKEAGLTCPMGPDDLVGDDYHIYKVVGPLRTHIKEGTNLTIRKKSVMGPYDLFYVDGSALDYTGHEVEWIGACHGRTYKIVGRFEANTTDGTSPHDLVICRNLEGTGRNPQTNELWQKHILLEAGTGHGTSPDSCGEHLTDKPIPAAQQNTDDSAEKGVHPGAAHGGTG